MQLTDQLNNGWYAIRYRVDELIEPFKLLRKRLSNVVAWLPTIWYNRNDDSDDFIKIIRTKLIISAGIFENSDKPEVTRQIRECIDLCDNLLNKKFAEEVMKPYYEKYPAKSLEDWKLRETQDARELYQKMLKERDNKEAALKEKLFGIIRDNYGNWWI